MPKVTIDDARGLVEEPGTGVTVSSSVALSGAASVAAASGLTCNDFLAGFVPNAASATTTTGAVSVANYMTFLSVTGTVAYTLAAGTAVGQLKKIMCVVALTTPAGTLTIANPVSGATDTVLFTALGDTLDLIWTGSAWRILGAYNVASGNITTPVVS